MYFSGTQNINELLYNIMFLYPILLLFGSRNIWQTKVLHTGLILNITLILSARQIFMSL